MSVFIKHSASTISPMPVNVSYKANRKDAASELKELVSGEVDRWKTHPRAFPRTEVGRGPHGASRDTEGGWASLPHGQKQGPEQERFASTGRGGVSLPCYLPRGEANRAADKGRRSEYKASVATVTSKGCDNSRESLSPAGAPPTWGGWKVEGSRERPDQDRRWLSWLLLR